MEALRENFFNLQVYGQVFPYLLNGLWSTVWLSLLVIPLGLLTGLALAIVATRSRPRWPRVLVAIHVDFFRAFPPLVLLIFIYFATPFFGWDMPKLAAVALGFTLNTSSYYAEVFRAGLSSVPKGQDEAARSTGLGAWQALCYVTIPQATRNVLPDLLGNSIEVVKMTTLASVVALPELLKAARDAQSMIYNPSPVVLAALMYLLLLWPLVRLLSHIERRHLGQARRRVRQKPA
ncbi:amino acid ABC transporter permease [Pseudomonas sp. nanlin1]|uniref:amino acid ABC transporter permease n=1 Tax=Pseudomonas sp. nanlin1 TaxID=3040605 RepID=UPI00388E9D7A